ncbi:MAG: methylated-DNA--[protein]-cysteine S-methyltransferase [Acidimicrobiales bacterium]
MMTHTVVDSPVGPLTLVASDGVLSGLFMDDQRHRPDPSGFGERDGRSFAAISEQLDAYFDGTLDHFDVELAVLGTEWQRRVWAGLSAIPYGTTISYGELAARVGNPRASRAVGLANGRNPVGIIVPCHRVVGSSGSLTGYGGGLERKRWLLDHERKVLAG